MPVALTGSGFGRRLAVAFRPHAADNAWLDLLRTLAIILVLCRHGQRVANAGPELTPLETLFLNGWAGVDLFLVLSGYLVTKGLVSEVGAVGSIDVAAYAKRRFRRIVPAYVFVLLLVVVGCFPGFSVSTDQLALRIGYHLLFLQDCLPSNINVVFWSLGVEAKFYALVPLLVLPVLRLDSRFGVLAVVLAIAGLSPLIRGIGFLSIEATEYQTFWSLLRSPFYTCLEPLMFGFGIAILESRGHLRLPQQQSCVLFATSLVLILALLSGHDFMAEINFWDATLQPMILSALFALMLLAAINMNEVQLPLSAVFRYGARLSYSLYLVHFPLLPMSMVLGAHVGIGTAGFWLIYISFSLVYSVLILAYIELPFWTPKRRPELEAPPRAPVVS